MRDGNSEAMEVDFEQLGELTSVESDADDSTKTLIKGFVEDSSKSLRILTGIREEIYRKVATVTDNVISMVNLENYDRVIQSIESFISLIMIRIHYTVFVIQNNINWFSKEENWAGKLDYKSYKNLYESSQKIRHGFMVNAMSFVYDDLPNLEKTVLEKVQG